MKPEDIQFLKELGKELREQDTDCQASPRFWVVGDYEETWVPDGEGDTKFVLPEWDYAVLEFDELRKALIEDYEDAFNESQWEDLTNDLEAFGVYYEDDLLALAQVIDRDARVISVEDRHVIKENTMFLTKQACRDHIEANRHHYTDRVHTYAMTAWRSPKVERLLKILESIE